jgi:hypothetical protein
MTGLETIDREPLDRKTLRSIRDAVGERLQQSLKPQFIGPSPQLDRLVDELRRRDSDNGPDTQPGGGFF